MNLKLSRGVRIILTFLCFGIAVVGFIMKLPSQFRQYDKQLHAAFYFLAAAFLNILFVQRRLWRHVLVFVLLYVFGMGIEYAQEYSKRRFRIAHGRFDPEDVQSNLNGLIAFSVLWVLIVGGYYLYQASRSK